MTADSTKTNNSRTQAGTLLGRHSIRLKLILIMMAVSSAALLLVGAAFVAGQVVFFREQMKSDLATQAELLAENTRSGVVLDVPEDTTRVLSSLKHKDTIQYACVFEPDGNIFADYVRQGWVAGAPPEPEPKGLRFSEGCLHVWEPIMWDEVSVGTVYLRSDQSEV